MGSNLTRKSHQQFAIEFILSCYNNLLDIVKNQYVKMELHCELPGRWLRQLLGPASWLALRAEKSVQFHTAAYRSAARNAASMRQQRLAVYLIPSVPLSLSRQYPHQCGYCSRLRRWYSYVLLSVAWPSRAQSGRPGPLALHRFPNEREQCTNSLLGHCRTREGKSSCSFLS